MEKANPLVTVNILSYNRRDELRNTLQKVYSQNYKNIEVIVVDNNSTDGSAEMVESEFTSVKLIKLKKNIGIAGWNEGFRVAKGEYVLVLDDDSYPEKESIIIAVEELKNNHEISVIAFNVFNVTSEDHMYRFPGGWLPDNDVEKCKWDYFVGCAFLIKFSLYFNNLFPSAYFICFHEMPIIRYLQVNGYSIFYNCKIKAYHVCQNQLNTNKEYFHYRNFLNFVLWNVSFPFNLFYGIRIFFFYFFRSVKRGWFIKFFKALLYQSNCLHGYKILKMNKRERKIFFQNKFLEYKISRKILKSHRFYENTFSYK